MMAGQVAEHLDAKRAGASRWMAKCPAHNDRLPSLSIGVGSSGRTLLNCHAGCSVDSILKASGMSRRDLFTGPQLSKTQIDALAASREAEQARYRTERALIRSVESLAMGQLRQLDLAVNFLGGRLMGDPTNDSLAEALEQVLSEFRRIEAIADHIGFPWIMRGRYVDHPPFVNGYNPMAQVATLFNAEQRSYPHAHRSRKRKESL